MAKSKQGRLNSVFSFPNPVNEVSARLVAAGVVVMCVAYLATDIEWILVPLAYGFTARVLTGPSLSPLGQLVTRFVTPRLGIAERLTAGPPKRFAQGMGCAMSVAAAALVIGFGERAAGGIFVAGITMAATLESAFGFCIGCKVFALLMRHGIIPPEVCLECNDVALKSRLRERVTGIEPA